MGLSLLAPLALGLSVLALLPVLAHLARQTPRDRQPFGAMLLLQRVVKRLRRRRRVKDPWLLLLRVLGLLAVALAVAGPRFSYPGGIPEYGASGRVVVVLDRSLSMSALDSGATLLQQVRERARSLVDGLPEGVLLGLVVFDDEALGLTTSLTPDHDRVLAQIAAVQPSSGSSNLRSALLEARRLLAGEPGEVILLSDEAGPRIVADARPEIERLVDGGSSIVPLRLAADPPRNVAVVDAKYGDGLEGGHVVIRVANYGPDPLEVPCEITLPDGAVIPVFVDLPPEGEAEERTTVPSKAQGGVGEVRCEDPDLPRDDARYFHLPRVGASRVLVVDGDPGDTPTRSEVYFLERALAPWGGRRSGVTIDVVPPAGLRALDPEVHRVVFLANVADPRSAGPRLTEFVRKGGNLVISGGDNVTADRYNAAFGSILPAALRRPRSIADRGEEGVPLALPDLDDELLAPFRRSGRGSFSRIRSHTALTLESYDDVPGEIATRLRYASGLPALIERRIGQGRVLVWTSSFDTGWTNLPLQATFIPLVQRIVSYLGAEAGQSATRFEGVVGRPVEVPLPDVAMEPTVRGPDGPVRSRIDGARLRFVPDRAGAYALELQQEAPLAFVAVNTEPTESDVRPYDSVAEVEREIDPELLTRHVDLSLPLLWAGLVLLAASAGLALWRRS